MAGGLHCFIFLLLWQLLLVTGITQSIFVIKVAVVAQITITGVTFIEALAVPMSLCFALVFITAGTSGGAGRPLATGATDTFVPTHF